MTGLVFMLFMYIRDVLFNSSTCFNIGIFITSDADTEN